MAPQTYGGILKRQVAAKKYETVKGVAPKTPAQKQMESKAKRESVKQIREQKSAGKDTASRGGGELKVQRARESFISDWYNKQLQEYKQKQLDKVRYTGNLGSLKIEDGKLDKNQNLQNYKVEYYSDGVTPKKILSGKKTYTIYKYGNSIRDKDDYYQNEWTFYPDGSIQTYRKKYDYTSDKGKVGQNTSYYSREVRDKERWDFSDEDGILTSYNKYQRQRSGDNDWSNENVYTENYLNGIKIEEINRLWSNRDRNWYKIDKKDFLAGTQTIDQDFTSYAPEVKREVVSSRVIYEDSPTQPGGKVPSIRLTTYKSGDVELKDLKTGLSEIQKISDKPFYASEIEIPSLGIKSFQIPKEQQQFKQYFQSKEVQKKDLTTADKYVQSIRAALASNTKLQSDNMSYAKRANNKHIKQKNPFNVKVNKIQNKVMKNFNVNKNKKTFNNTNKMLGNVYTNKILKKINNKEKTNNFFKKNIKFKI